MLDRVPSPAEVSYGFVTGRILFLLIHLLGSAAFIFTLARRLTPLVHGPSDPRFDRPLDRLANVVRFWLGQWKQPRYLGAGILHIFIFAGFLILAFRSLAMIAIGTSPAFSVTGFPGFFGQMYGVLKDYASTTVLICIVVAGIRRVLFKPARYVVPAKYGKDHTPEALLVLGMIAMLMVSESLFGATASLLSRYSGAPDALPPFTLAWGLAVALRSASHAQLLTFYSGAYLVHELTFFSFLCFLPMGKHFHVITSLFNVYFAKLERGAIKPVLWNVAEDKLDGLSSLGVKSLGEFTWKHLLDFYSCADCGRCSDNCPANAAGRPLSPRFLTIKARDALFQQFPVMKHRGSQNAVVGTVYSDDEIWSCTTCGACEEECPLLIEYIDKIVDLRRGLVDDGKVPQSIQTALKHLETRGNPYGKLPKKRADWATATDLAEGYKVRTLNGAETAETLYFTDSITSYDGRIQSIARAGARILSRIGEDFGLLGTTEKDSGHDVRRFGEETLFQALRNHNREAIRTAGVKRIVTSDPHAFNALRHDYGAGMPPVEHISQVIAREVRSGSLKLNTTAADKVYTYHDACYLGRHNRVYDEPRDVLDSIPGLKRVEMRRCRDRSFCCGGGGLMLFYEPKEEQRMGVIRVRMAAEAGANVIVTACPFCMVNMEDAVKVAGLEGSMSVIDLAELVNEHMQPEAPAAPQRQSLETLNVS